MFDTLLQKPGHAVIRACADDGGAAVRDITALPIFATSFDSIAKASHLTLNLAKTHLVPLSKPFGPAVVDGVRAWLAGSVPGWAG
eukprot:7716661-Karenia_brevis.AAC.1